MSGGLTAFPAIVTGIIEFVNIRNGQFSRTGLWLNIVGFTIAVGMLVLMFAAGIAIYNVAQPILRAINQMNLGPPRP